MRTPEFQGQLIIVMDGIKEQGGEWNRTKLNSKNRVQLPMAARATNRRVANAFMDIIEMDGTSSIKIKQEMEMIKNTENNSGASTPVEADAEKTGSEGMPPKRPRGRPRKHPVTVPAQPASAPMAEAQTRNASDSVK